MGRQMTDDEILVFLYDSLKNPENVHFMPIINDRRVKECRVKYNNDKWSMVFDTLELFAFGTWEDYVRGRSDGRYLILNEEAFNLKILSLMSARKELNIGAIPYDMLYEKIGVEVGNTWDLEQIVIGAIQRGLMAGYIDQETKTVYIRNIVSRDVKLSEAEKLAEQAKSWCEKIDIKLDKMMTDDKQRKKTELAMAKHESEHQIKLNRVFNYVKADMIAHAGSSQSQPKTKKTKQKSTTMMTT